MLLLGMHIPMDGQVENIMPLAAHVISNRSITVESKQRNALKQKPTSVTTKSQDKNTFFTSRAVLFWGSNVFLSRVQLFSEQFLA